MRTTLRLDDDVLLAVQERARREKRTAGQVLSDLARQALTAQQHPSHGDESGEHHGFRPSRFITFGRSLALSSVRGASEDRLTVL